MFSKQVAGTTGEQMTALEAEYGTVNQAAHASVYDRATVLMSLSRAPAVDLKPTLASPMTPGGVVQMPSSRDDRLVVTVLQGAAQAGDLPLMLNMADSFLVLSKMEDESQWQRASSIMARSYYPTLDVLNATSLIQKWGADRMNPRSAFAIRSILNALPPQTRQQVNAALRQGQ